MIRLNIKLLERLNAQAEEAENIGVMHVANHIDECIVKNAEIQSPKSIYCAEEYQHDIESAVWDAVLATASFHGASNIDALEIQKFVEKVADDLKSSCKNQIKIKTAIGAYENKLPGEE
jgi:hypothetical protein